jgi:hypothetical protein
MNNHTEEQLVRFARKLIDQRSARVLVEPNARRSGYWFGGGNAIIGDDGALYVCGRYRNEGDSRTGTAAGTRGLEFAVFRSESPWPGDRGFALTKVVSRTKESLSTEEVPVVSIEGSALNRTPAGVELFISTEKGNLAYPPGLEAFQKPGTGVWTIDHISARTVEELADAPVKPLLGGNDPQYWHIKDPVVHRSSAGDTILFFCTHPFSWTSSNSAYCVRRGGMESADVKEMFDEPRFDFFPRGFVWDVAVSRITDALELPSDRTGMSETAAIVFYDGAECIRDHDENPQAVRRPRGYSCEEISGLAMYSGDDPSTIRRISRTEPHFVSPWGTGSSRYIQTLATDRGVIATWQQAQKDGSQPLVIHALTWEEIRDLLAS